MCLIIDTCSFHAVFNSEDINHFKYKPILNWVTEHKAKIIIGGTKYKKELIGKRYLSIIAEFERKNQIVKLPDVLVDGHANRLLKIVKQEVFDDEHLVAMVIVSKCRIVCTSDAAAIPFLRDKSLYPRDIKKPKIYMSARNSKLCCQKNIAEICK